MRAQKEPGPIRCACARERRAAGLCVVRVFGRRRSHGLACRRAANRARLGGAAGARCVPRASVAGMFQGEFNVFERAADFLGEWALYVIGADFLRGSGTRDLLL
mmetsp:Transcript_17616/g.50310  ORF Transcript_17616/g.50310 Transcript_17616/m.50310 type:complete len:104 (-) Transcript_17616:272-583(-)